MTSCIVQKRELIEIILRPLSCSYDSLVYKRIVADFLRTDNDELADLFKKETGLDCIFLDCGFMYFI